MEDTSRAKMPYISNDQLSKKNQYDIEILEYNASHLELSKLLKDTNNRELVEASPLDKIWGVGLGENDPLILDSANWLGKNMLGYALMEVRDMI